MPGNKVALPRNSQKMRHQLEGSGAEYLDGAPSYLENLSAYTGANGWLFIQLRTKTCGISCNTDQRAFRLELTLYQLLFLRRCRHCAGSFHAAQSLGGQSSGNHVLVLQRTLYYRPVLLALPVFALLGYVIPAIMYRHAVKQSVVERLREAEA